MSRSIQLLKDNCRSVKTECTRVTFLRIRNQVTKTLLKQRSVIGSDTRKDYHNKFSRFQEWLKKESHKTSLFAVELCEKGVSKRSLVFKDDMDIKTLLYNLREEVSCSVCSNIFTDPKQLTCLHSFCLHCLKQWYRTSHGRDTIGCPNCQALSTVPTSGDLTDFPTSFYLNGLIDVLAIKECQSSQ